MSERKVNFNPGPAALPRSVLEKLAASTLELDSTGLSVCEISHRSPEFAAIIEAAQQRLCQLFALPDDYKVLFLGGGASLQFCMLAMNLLKGGVADYVNTGTWAKKAAAEARRFGEVHLAGDGSEEGFVVLPRSFDQSRDARYLHVTTNNTIYGTQYRDLPDTGAVPLIADMSSDILSHRWDSARFSMIYAGAQKNLGPSGVTLVILKEALLEQCADDLPTMLSYRTHAEKNSLFNTPPVTAIYTVKLVLDWIAEQGGVEAIEAVNEAKAKLLYGAIDDSEGYYRGTVKNAADRSYMNVTFRLGDESLEQAFLSEGAAKGLHGMKGHRSVGGVRISMYNAISLDDIERLVSFMQDFRASH